jgi:hypothetical protein
MTVAGAVVLATATATVPSRAFAASSTAATSATEPTDPVVQPNPASPGAQVWIYDANHCTTPTGTATSQALIAPIPLAPLSNMTGGGGTLRDGLPAGTYTITLHCGSTLTTTIHITTTRAPSGVAVPADGSAEDHLGIGDAAVGAAFLLGGLSFATATLIRRRRAAARR